MDKYSNHAEIFLKFYKMAIELTDREFKIHAILKEHKKTGLPQYKLFKKLKKDEKIHYTTFNKLLFSLRFKELITIKTQMSEKTKRRIRMVCLIS